MNRSELVEAIAGRTGLLAADISMVLDGLKDVVGEKVGVGERVQIAGLLTFERVHRPERQGRNPRTGEPLTVPAGYTLRVSPGQSLKAAAKGG